MPDLSKEIIDNLNEKLTQLLADIGIKATPSFLDAGGSAAVFKVPTPEGARAFKVFDPKFINDPNNLAEKRRLELQERLIGHDCPFIVQTYRVVEAYNTAFIEMEFIEWPQLKKQLNLIPDDSVSVLINQLVDAVRYLEQKGIIHRDIKPENIHISEDFKNLKLLDLGVAREFEIDNGAAITDSNNLRPFLATAQYSSPEYLFRLDAPSTKLWNGLNLYQVGAVLHDLIMKKPLFNEEISLGNRWLVARAVLTKSPDFNDGQPERLAQLKSVAFRCLTKDIDARLSIVSWDDFISSSDTDPLKSLRSRLSKITLNTESANQETLKTKLAFERNRYFSRIIDKTRIELYSVCGPELPITVRTPPHSPENQAVFIFCTSKKSIIECRITFSWGADLQAQTAEINLSAKILADAAEGTEPTTESKCKAVCCGQIGSSENEAAMSVVNSIAAALTKGLDIIEASENLAHKSDLDLL